MAGQEDVTLTLHIIVDCTPTGDSTCRVRVCGLEWDNAMGVHGGVKGGEVRELSTGKVGERENRIKASYVASEGNGIGTTWTCEPGS